MKTPSRVFFLFRRMPPIPVSRSVAATLSGEGTPRRDACHVMDPVGDAVRLTLVFALCELAASSFARTRSKRRALFYFWLPDDGCSVSRGKSPPHRTHQLTEKASSSGFYPYSLLSQCHLLGEQSVGDAARATRRLRYRAERRAHA